MDFRIATDQYLLFHFYAFSAWKLLVVLSLVSVPPLIQAELQRVVGDSLSFELINLTIKSRTCTTCKDSSLYLEILGFGGYPLREGMEASYVGEEE